MYGFVSMWIVVMLALDSFDVRVLDSSVRENQGISIGETKGIVCLMHDDE